MSFINIEGLIGSGKSTLCKNLNKKFNYPMFLEGVKDNKALELFYTDMTRYSFLLQMEFLFQRFVQHKSALHLSTLTENIMVLTDRGLLFDVVFSKLMVNMGTMSEVEYDTYINMRNTLMSQTALPDAIFYIGASPEVSLERIKKRARGIETGITIDYLKDLEITYRAELNLLDKHVPIFFLPDEIVLNTEEVNRFILHKLNTLTTKLFALTRKIGD